ncbi:type IV pilus twitching motility protein PilT [Hydrogenobaculum acidophilum]
MLLEILSKAKESSVSDIHLKVGSKPFFRAHKHLYKEESLPAITENDMQTIVKELTQKYPNKLNEFQEKGEIDISYETEFSRYRVNIYKQKGYTAIALRVLSNFIPHPEEINLPKVMPDTVLKYSKGLILVTGPTGSGKSTTLASLIDRINESYDRTIITVEDPIEYVYKDKKSYIVQREIGLDTTSFQTGLRAALREDPDVILVGEIRDTETALIALQAAETGHLVFSTLHTIDAKETINRFIGMFPLEMREQIKIMLASALVAIFSQRLLPRADKPGVIPAIEILLNVGATKDILLDPTRLDEIPELLRRNKAAYGTQDFDTHLLELYNKGLISKDVALLNASKPQDMSLKMQGIT